MAQVEYTNIPLHKLDTSLIQNPELLQIRFHLPRHWKATTEYAKTKDILHVKEILGHKTLTSTMMYTQLINFKDDEYTAKVALLNKKSANSFSSC